VAGELLHPGPEPSTDRLAKVTGSTIHASGERDVGGAVIAERPFDRRRIGRKWAVEQAMSVRLQAGAMPTRERYADRGTRTARSDAVRLGSDLRSARVAAGLSLRNVGEVAGISGSQISRIERGLASATSVAQLARIGAVVGLDVRIRAYPGGDPLRDAGQLQVTYRFRKRLPADVTIRLEVPLPIPGDLRAWDMILGHLLDEEGRFRAMPVEVESRISDAQAQIRRIQLKLRDSDMEIALVVVADTPSNRRAIAAASGIIAGMFPISPRKALAALAEGRYPGGSSLIFI